jgi:hypothetical protein
MRLSRAREWRKDEGYDERWRRMRDLYQGKHFDKSTTEDQIAVNIMFSTVNVILPSVAINNPKFTVNALREAYAPQAQIAESVLNFWWRHFDFKSEVQQAVKDYLIYGPGFIKVGYRFEEEEVNIADDEWNELYDKQRAEADQAAEREPELAGDLPTDNDIADSIETKKTVTKTDEVFVERVSPFDVYLDPEAVDLVSCTWIAQRITRPLEDVKRDQRYSAGARKDLVANRTAENPITGKESDQPLSNDVDTQRVEIWEFYDIQRGIVCVFPEEGDKFLVKPEAMPYAFGHPFEMLSNYEVPDRLYPMGELEALESLQDELNATRSQMMNHRKTNNRKWIARRDAFDTEGVTAIASNQDNTVVWVDGPDTNLEDSIKAMPSNSPDPQLYNYSEQIESDLDRISGLSEYQRGALPELSRTATEASIIQDAANARSADKLAEIEGLYRQIGRKLLAIAQQYLTGEQAAHVVGANGTVWFNYTAEDIQGEFDFNVEAGSTQPQNETFKRQQAMQLMNTMTPFVSMGIVNATELARQVLRDGFGIDNPAQLLGPDPAVAEEQMRQLQMQQQMAGGEQAALEPGPEIPPGEPMPPEMDPSAVGPQLGEGMLTQMQAQLGLDLPHMDPRLGGGAMGPGSAA